MTRWFRFYDEAINDPKVLRLTDELYRAWTILLCLTSKNDGNLPPADDIALALRMKLAKVCEWLTKLHAGGLLDKTETGFQPHNWNGRQYKSDVSTDRVKRFRNGQRNVSETASETAPEQKQITDTEKKETRTSALVDDGWPKDYREQFWNRYPNKVGKPKALAKLDAARKRGVSWLAIVHGLDRYTMEKPADRAWLNPETFLNQERWTDQPAKPDQRQETPLNPSEIDWDAICDSYKKFGVWSKHAPGNSPDSSSCQCPPEILRKYGLLIEPREPPIIPRPQSMSQQ